MKFNFKKMISIAMSFCLVFTLCFGNSFALGKNIDSNKNITTIINNDMICTVMGEYKGDKLYATLNKETNKITMQLVEKSKMLGVSIGQEKKTNYEVVIDNAIDGKVSAVIINTETKEKHHVSKDSDKVIAQLPAVIPLIEIIGIAIIEALLIAATAIVVGGVTYYVATKVADMLRQKSYDFYLALLSGGTVYIGSSIDFETALARVGFGGDIFARTGDLARMMAVSAGGSYRGPECHGDEGYFDHYHPKYGTYAPYAHCFF